MKAVNGIDTFCPGCGVVMMELNSRALLQGRVRCIVPTCQLYLKEFDYDRPTVELRPA